MSLPDIENTTVDAALGGRVLLEQSRRGYRFNADSVILAHRAAAHGSASVLDACAGVGPVALCIAALSPRTAVTAVELQPSLFELLARNVTRNSAQNCSAVLADLRSFRTPSSFEVVVMNPPYFEPGAGRVSDTSERAFARHQLAGDLSELLGACAKAVSPNGVIEFVYPSLQLGNALAICTSLGFGEQRVRLQHKAPDSAAQIAFVSVRRAKLHRTQFESPLFAFESDGEPGQEYCGILRGDVPLGDDRGAAHASEESGKLEWPALAREAP